MDSVDVDGSWDRTLPAAIRSSTGNLVATGAQGRLTAERLLTLYPQARTPSHLPSSRADGAECGPASGGLMAGVISDLKARARILHQHIRQQEPLAVAR